MKTLITLAISLFFSLIVKGQISFQKSYGVTGTDAGNSVLALSDGYLIAGSAWNAVSGAKDVSVFKTDLSGNLLWNKTYGGTATDEAFSIQKTSDGNFIVAGVTESFIGPALSDISNVYLLKIDSFGNLIWSQSINSGSRDIAYAVKETFDNGFILAGTTAALNPTPTNVLVIKTDSMGVISWAKTFTGLATQMNEIARSVVQTADSGFAIFGYSISTVAGGDTSLYFIKTNAAGTQWMGRHYAFTTGTGPHQAYGYDIIKNTNGNLLFAGALGGYYSANFYAYSPILLEADNLGMIISAKGYSLNSGDCRAYSVRQTADGGYLLGGQMGNYYPMMIKTNDTLGTQWTFYYGNFTGPNFSNGVGFAAVQSLDSGYVITGYKNEATGPDVHLVKTNASGQSGCNEGIPNLLGVSGNLVQTSVIVTLTPVTIGSGTAALTVTGAPLMTDSTLCLPSGTDEFAISNSALKIFPNPSHGIFQITFPDQKTNYTLEVINTLGQKVFATQPETKNQKSETKLDLSFLPKGIYVLKINDSASALSSKFVIE